MKGRINNKLGEIQINPEVIAKYAGITAVECFGIVGMAAVSMKDGLVKLLKKERDISLCWRYIYIKGTYGFRYAFSISCICKAECDAS